MKSGVSVNRCLAGQEPSTSKRGKSEIQGKKERVIRNAAMRGRDGRNRLLEGPLPRLNGGREKKKLPAEV